MILHLDEFNIYIFNFMNKPAMRAAKAHEPAQPRKIASVLTAHKHIEEMHALAVNLKSVKPLR